ncbi:unnamed protein product [Rotaria socialis]|uniref:DDE Tnp4 domain-containing protein n=1 Tax=Rotaria socialis TaxID=392032 RepID=A0A821VS13_9BILA|nr:unnamed protein product [Rotaria socialis]
MSNTLLTVLFQLPDKRTVSRCIESARSALINEFVPKNLGFAHIGRNDIIHQHTSTLAQYLLCENEPNTAIVVIDSTYIYIQDDVIVVDRGFRDCVNAMEDLGLNVVFPPFLNGRKQFTTMAANQSRFVTKVRWVVEAANGRIKQFKFLANTAANSSLPHLEQYLSIVCSIINRYRPPIKTSSIQDTVIADQMISLRNQKKNFEAFLQKSNLKKNSSTWETIDHSDILHEFPIMTEDEIVNNITLGTL